VLSGCTIAGRRAIVLDMSAQTRRLQRPSLPQLVVDQLLGDVERGQLRAGQTLPPESELAAQFGVSRAVVREALKSLQAQGLVEVVNGVGSVVRGMTSMPLEQFFTFAARLSEVSIQELLEVRRGLEVEAASLAAGRAGAAEIAGLGRLVDSMAGSVREPAVFADFDTAFHVAIARASRNPMLVLLVEAIRVPLRRSVEEGLTNWIRTGEVDTVRQIHADVFESIRSGDPDRAAKAMDIHFAQAMQIIGQAGSPPTVRTIVPSDRRTGIALDPARRHAADVNQLRP
jgi:GntR family transcriptional repressor for pyruvate dehydrogenase complex